MIPEDQKKIIAANHLLPKRENLDEFIDGMIRNNGLDTAGIVGFSSMFNQNLPVFAMARRIKAINPKVLR